MNTTEEINDPSPGEKVFTNWELVKKIFSYLPWNEVCRLRNVSAETRYACRHCVKEINDPLKYGIKGELFKVKERRIRELKSLPVTYDFL